MAGRECYHCKQWVEEGQAHDCWTTTEAALTRELSDDLRDAWERLRETAVEFGDQRVYASHSSIRHPSQRWCTCCGSPIETRWKLRSPTGCARRTSCPTSWRRGRRRRREPGGNERP